MLILSENLGVEAAAKLSLSDSEGIRALNKKGEKVMNGGTRMLKSETVIFPLKLNEREVSEIEIGEMKSVKIDESRIEIRETRFARLKKSLRKRSASIL